MMDDKENFNIEELARQKSFDQLSEKEKQKILGIMDTQEYQDIHEFYKKLDKIIFKEQKIEPEDEIREKLLLQFQKNESKIKIFFTAKIPAYIALAAALLIFILTWSFQAPTLLIKEIHDTVQTVRYVKILTEIKNENNNEQVVKQNWNKIQKNIRNNDQNLKNNLQNLQFENPTLDYQRKLALVNIKKALNEKKGRNIKDDSALLSLLVRSY
jgi:hypothetical protein